MMQGCVGFTYWEDRGGNIDFYVDMEDMITQIKCILEVVGKEILQRRMNCLRPEEHQSLYSIKS